LPDIFHPQLALHGQKPHPPWIAVNGAPGFPSRPRSPPTTGLMETCLRSGLRLPRWPFILPGVSPASVERFPPRSFPTPPPRYSCCPHTPPRRTPAMFPSIGGLCPCDHGNEFLSWPPLPAIRGFVASPSAKRKQLSPGPMSSSSLSCNPNFRWLRSFGSKGQPQAIVSTHNWLLLPIGCQDQSRTLAAAGVNNLTLQACTLSR